MASCDRIELALRGAPVVGEVLLGTDVTGGVAAGDVRWVLSGPSDAEGLIVVAGSSFSGGRRTHPFRPTLVRQLHGAGLAVLHVDVLGPAFDQYRGRLELPSWAARLAGAALSMPAAFPHHRPIGLLGEGRAAAVALWAAADLGQLAAAVVCWSGQLDAVGPRLGNVSAATLLAVGDGDDAGMARNLEAQGGLHCRTHLRVVRGATELFTEPGTLVDVEAATVAWFIRHLIDEPRIPRPAPLDLAG